MQATAMMKSADTEPWYKHRWPWLLMLGPAVVVVAGLTTAWIAYTRQDALVVDDYYKAGKAINQDLRRDKLAAALQMSADMRYDPAAGKLTGRLESPVRAADGVLTIRLVHSTQPEKDIKLAVQPASDGSFSAVLGMVEQARWQVQVESGSGDWRLAAEWDWPKQRSVALRAMLQPADN